MSPSPTGRAGRGGSRVDSGVNGARPGMGPVPVSFWNPNGRRERVSGEANALAGDECWGHDVRESKGELTDRLRREGRWESFVRRREQLKAEGVAASDAWDLAAAEFPPENPLPEAVGPAGGYLRPIEPWLEWEQGRKAVEAATNDLAWLFHALPVRLPDGIGKVGLCRMLARMRANPRLLDEFYRLMMTRMAEREDRMVQASPRDCRSP